MTIKYKFNKSSEARDCVIESVELQEEKRIEIEDFELKDKINNYEEVYKELIDEEEWRCKYYKSEYRINDIANVDIRVVVEWTDWGNYADYLEDLEIIAFYKTTTESKFFTSQQELKDYINTIQEPIEFIAESSIDDVLMKEWIGEWNTEVYFANSDDELFRSDEKYNFPLKRIVGSPKLNSNWTFKIE
jgi:hypothetical protein